jgi:hypothetical protein
MLIEEILPGNHPLIIEIFGNSHLSDERPSYAATVYLKNRSPKIITSVLIGADEFVDQSMNFTSLFHTGLSYWECLMLTTFYYSKSIPTLQRMMQSYLTIDESIVSLFLTSTNGFLLYSYQFEYLAQALLSMSAEESIQLRRSFNRRKPDWHQAIKNRDNREYFEQVLKERLIGSTVAKPNFVGAHNLFEYVKSVREN